MSISLNVPLALFIALWGNLINFVIALTIYIFTYAIYYFSSFNRLFIFCTDKG